MRDAPQCPEVRRIEVRGKRVEIRCAMNDDHKGDHEGRQGRMTARWPRSPQELAQREKK